MQILLQIYILSARELLRNRIGLILLFLIPGFFLSIAIWTAGEGALPIKLFFQNQTEIILVTQQKVSLIFIAASVSGFLTAFYANILFHKNFEYQKYCISLGLKPSLMIIGKFMFFISIVIVMAIFISVIISLVIPIEQKLYSFAGFVLLGVVYGAYGGIVGVINKDYMVALLLIVLLANLDIGWLQNPVFYSYAQETEIIHWLPAFYPSQFILTSTFTNLNNYWSVLMSFLYILSFLLLLFLIMYLKTRNLYHE
ncbi:MAG: hypothetical protein ABFS12_11615 [Bacteroidota bacterium]